jgi:hypothetical protein
MDISMKKTIFWLLAFSITFGLSYLVVPTVFEKFQHEVPKQTVENASPVLPENSSPQTIEIINVKPDDFDDTKDFIVKLLEPGEGFHGEEVIGKSGEVWLGLFEENDKYFLRPTKLKITNVHDGIADELKWQKTGKNVGVSDKSSPIFLLKNADYLEKGEIATFQKGLKYSDIPEDSEVSYDKLMTSLNVGFSQSYEVNGVYFKLEVIEAIDQQLKKVFAVVLSGDGKSQIVHTSYDDSDGLGTLYWVGDLDKDGKPDFYMDLYVHYNVGNQTLFLSSKAGENELIRQVAVFWTTGC